jgi:pimeloyl-ACP methyl ester carboxylesterase
MRRPVARMAPGLPWALALAGVLSAACSSQGLNVGPKNDFVTVNGVRLHYVDWGGKGEWLLFLPANGGELVEQFGSLAPQFTDQFRVVGLTRRGTSPSEKPESGYDTDTLVGDIVGFLDAMGAPRANIAGHSVAGAEMTRVGGLHPSRIEKLVYLDAAVDYKLQSQLAAEAGMGPQPDHALAAILHGAAVRHPEYKRVGAPALSIKVVFDGAIPFRSEDDDAYKKFLKLAEQRDVIGTQIKQFEGGMARGELLILRNTTHGGFLGDREQQKIFVPVMREFLLRP